MWLRGFRASNASGDIGQYTAFLIPWKNGAIDGTRTRSLVYTYIVLSDPQYDTSNFDIAVRDTVNATLDTLQAWDNTRVDAATSTRMPRSDTLTIERSARKLIFNQGQPLANGDFEMEDSTATPQVPVRWRSVVAGGFLDGDGTQVKPASGRYLFDPNSGIIQSRDSVRLGTGHRVQFAASIWQDTTDFSAIPPKVRLMRAGTGVVDLAADFANFPKRQWVRVDTTFTITTAGWHTIEVAGEGIAGDTFYVDAIDFKIIDIGDTAAFTRANWDLDILGLNQRHLDSVRNETRINSIDTLRFVIATDTARNATVALSNSDIDKISDNALERKRGTVTAGASTSSFRSTALTEADNYWNQNQVQFLSGAAAQQVARISAFTAATDSVTFTPATSITPAVGDSFAIIAILGEAATVGTIDSVRAVGNVGNIGSGPFTSRIVIIDSGSSPRTVVAGGNVSLRDSATLTLWSQTFNPGSDGLANFGTIGSKAYFIRYSRVQTRLATNADTLVQVAAANTTDTLQVIRSEIAALGVSGTVTVYAYETGPNGAGIPGLEVTARLTTTEAGGLVQFSGTDSAKWMNNIPQTTFTSGHADSLGLWRLALIPPATLRDTCANYTITVKGRAGQAQITKTISCVKPPNAIGQIWIVRSTDPCPTCP